MAIYRTVYMNFWKDTKIIDDFTPEDKYFMLYCLTNDYTNLCGCFEISIKQMSIDTGYNVETIERLLNRFEKVHNIIFYNKQNKEMLIKNWYKYNWTKSEKLDKPLLKEIEKIKTPKFKSFLINLYNKRDTVSIPYIYTIDTSDADADADTDSVSDSVSDIKKEEKKNKYETIVNIYNEYCSNLSQVQKLTDKRKTAINKLLKTITEEQFKEICIIANNSDFLIGDNNSGWKADFDFIVKVDKAVSILEGKYSNKKRDKIDGFIDLWKEAEEKDEKDRNGANNNSFSW